MVSLQVPGEAYVSPVPVLWAVGGGGEVGGTVREKRVRGLAEEEWVESWGRRN